MPTGDPQRRQPRRQPPRDRGGDMARGGDTPRQGGGRRPVGVERARQSEGAPPRPPRKSAAPPRPQLPRDEEPQLPRGVIREIRRIIGDNRRADDVALALSIGSAAIDDDRPDVALEMLAWAKSQAARVATVREAYGIALYLAEDWAAAIGELRAYRRMTGRTDQNHVIADCHRALGRPLDDVISPLQELVEDDQAPRDRRFEALIIWAAALADSGDVGAGRALLRRAFDREQLGDDEPSLRLHLVAADLAERDGDLDATRHHLEVVAAADGDPFEVRPRLESLP